MLRHIKSHQTLLTLVSHVRLLHACYRVEFIPTQFLLVMSTLAGLRRLLLASLSKITSYSKDFKSDICDDGFFNPFALSLLDSS